MASQIRFEPHGVTGLVAPGTSIAAAAERLGVPIELRCGGVGECTSCAVRIADGPFSLSPLTDAERRMLSEAEVGASLRLGCQAKVGDSDCSIHLLDVAERPPMPADGAASSSSASSEGSQDGSSGDTATKNGGWFGFDPWPWTMSWGTTDEAKGCDDAGKEASANTESDRQPIDDVRRRILEAFGELPASERLATALELNMKAASDFFGAVLDGPLKAGEEAFDSLMKQAASVVREARQREKDASVPPESAPDSNATNDQEPDRP